MNFEPIDNDIIQRMSIKYTLYILCNNIRIILYFIFIIINTYTLYRLVIIRSSYHGYAENKIHLSLLNIILAFLKIPN